MKILALDDERIALESLCKDIKSVNEDAEVFPFSSANMALSWAKENSFDAAFLDIQGMDMDGLSLAKELKKLYPKCNIIFCTGYSEYAMDAFDLLASGYILKPATKAKIKKALENLRHEIPSEDKGLRLQCFGNFAIFFDGKPVEFKYTKSEELIAFLYDKQGQMCTKNEIMAYLWEDDNHVSYLKQIVKDMEDTFERLGLSSLILKQFGKIGLDYSAVKSDLKDFIEKKKDILPTYNGQYMNQFSWAEETAARLDTINKKK